MKMLSFFRLVRFPNLAIVALTQYLLQYFVMLPALNKAGLQPILDPFHFFLLVFTTMLIAAGGYLINDLLDYESDLINKPDLVFVNRVFSKKMVWGMYMAMTAIGFAIAWHLAVYVKSLPLVLIYPLAVFLLYYYSKKLKKIPLAGNIVVAVFCAFVAGVVLFAERDNYRQMGENGQIVSALFGGYLVFAFLSTLLREIVKDLEDMEGDKQLDLHTLPLHFGVSTAKKWAIGIGVALLCSLLEFGRWLWINGKFLTLVFMTLFVALILIANLFQITKAKSKSDYSKASFLAKILMLSGLILLILCKFA